MPDPGSEWGRSAGLWGGEVFLGMHRHLGNFRDFLKKKEGKKKEVVLELSLSKIRQQLPRLFRTTGWTCHPIWYTDFSGV